jgi:DNA-directed RNA polymerase specialized sigma subunit
MTLREIGEMLGLTPSRVCQLHSRALTTLRTGAAADRLARAVA